VEHSARDVAVEFASQAGIASVLQWASKSGEADGYERLTTAAVSADWEPSAVDEDTAWTIIYTSGTTGLPKLRAFKPRIAVSSPARSAS
jgi:acyl-coenzyme A synthetase/AMP-(fatty) acid ligase